VIAVVLLLGYAAVLCAVGMWWLPRASWPMYMPRLGIAVWQALTVTVIASGVLAGLALAVPALPASVLPAGLLRTCLPTMPGGYIAYGGAVAYAAGAVLTLAMPGRLVWSTMMALASAWRRRSSHDDALSLVARRGPAPGVLLLEDDTPMAYCVPGRRRIVVTTGAVRCLDGPQLEAVLAHERAHLSGRHHLVLALATAMQRSFPRIRLFSEAATQIACLVEMAADDAATRRSHRLTLASALLALAAARTPAGTLSAASTAAARRVRRLIEQLPPPRTKLAAISAVVAVALPILLFSAPAIALAVMAHCLAHLPA